ncbi:diacylglycerol kinase family protein [Dictyobacter arantiisoli]|uniref:Diacylglycerol kinase n=1 Tax=Dictyobacter arantiisoli TaxID=2014874 RepID=A0A5A5TA41_9CHLR|nr:diacylglycerol kinase family protein [Dictyobacter arantiisoli]GCF07849.1 diacylglycerol kinase [Dictyobacter arantiisoli]
MNQLSPSPEATKPAPAPLPNTAPKSEFAKFVRSFGYAFRGLGYTIRTQRNARVHIAVTSLVIVLGAILHLSAIEFAILLVTISAVFIAEMFNTVIEACVDLITPDYHPLARIAKDVAAGAVLASAIFSILIGLCIFGPHLWVVFFSVH